jgi:hypothetical protein
MEEPDAWLGYRLRLRIGRLEAARDARARRYEKRLELVRRIRAALFPPTTNA